MGSVMVTEIKTESPNAPGRGCEECVGNSPHTISDYLSSLAHPKTLGLLVHLSFRQQ